MIGRGALGGLLGLSLAACVAGPGHDATGRNPHPTDIAALGQSRLMIGELPLCSLTVKEAKLGSRQGHGSIGADYYLTIGLSEAASLAFGRMTSENVGRMLSITLDGQDLPAPRIMEPLLGGAFEISGAAEALERALRAANAPC